MVCCLTAPSHYLNQCWLIISKVLHQSPEMSKLLFCRMSLKILFSNLFPHFSEHNELKSTTPPDPGAVEDVLTTPCKLCCARQFMLQHNTRATGIILSMGSANERWRYIVTSSLISWAHTQNDPWRHTSKYILDCPNNCQYTMNQNVSSDKNCVNIVFYNTFSTFKAHENWIHQSSQ